MEKIVQLERKNNEGCVVETDSASIIIKVSKKPNGKILLIIKVQEEQKLNIYRINAFGVPENRRVKDGKSKEGNNTKS